MCFEDIVESFENLEYVKPPDEGITSYTLGMFFTMGRVLESQHI
jgi:hypothetical protein